MLTASGSLAVAAASPAAAATPKQFAYVASNTVSVINTATATVMDTVPVGNDPYGRRAG
jgi:YVTN family beta-propeller protein